MTFQRPRGASITDTEATTATDTTWAESFTEEAESLFTRSKKAEAMRERRRESRRALRGVADNKRELSRSEGGVDLVVMAGLEGELAERDAFLLVVFVEFDRGGKEELGAFPAPFADGDEL